MSREGGEGGLGGFASLGIGVRFRVGETGRGVAWVRERVGGGLGVGVGEQGRSSLRIGEARFRE